MNSNFCLRLLHLVTKDNTIVFDKEFEDHNTWTEAISHNISTVVFDYNKELKQNPDNAREIENDLVMRTTIDLPLIRCKDFTRVLTGQKVGRMEKFVGKVVCKLDIEYSMIHVWFSRIDAEDSYTYLGCVKASDLHMNGIDIKLSYNN